MFIIKKKWCEKYSSKFPNFQLDPKIVSTFPQFNNTFVSLSQSTPNQLSILQRLTHEDYHRLASVISFSMRKRPKLIINQPVIFIFLSTFSFWISSIIKTGLSFYGEQRSVFLEVEKLKEKILGVFSWYIRKK